MAAAAVPVAPAAATGEQHIPQWVLALPAAAMTLMLLAAAVVLVPARVLPREVAERIDGRRELLLFVGLCGLGVGFALTLLITVASS